MKKKVEANEIVDAEISLVSLVTKAANRQKFRILKRANGLAREVSIKKTAAQKQIAYAEVYRPNSVDSQGDFMTAEGIEAMAHSFLKKGLVRGIDTQHNGVENGSVVVESFIARKGDPDFAEGAWVMGVHVPDKKLWDAIVKGQITGFSMFGTGDKVKRTIEVEKSATVDASPFRPYQLSTEVTAPTATRPYQEAERDQHGEPEDIERPAPTPRHGAQQPHPLDGLVSEALARHELAERYRG